MNKNKSGEEDARSRKKQRVEKNKRKTITNDTHDESDISDTDKFSDDEEGGIHIDDIYIPPAPPPVCSYESTGPRVIITHIVNENFKSYAGRVVVGPFDKSFSSIVGPNGSGKSNVIDSMLFVFGYRATKIRSKKVSVLIHKSEQHQNVPSCKVEVHFVQILDKKNGEYEKVPGSEFIIARTAFQNSSSFYELNNKRVQFKEVAMTLRKYGIDLIHNRFLILQGEVEQIALMKPKAQHPHETGMLEYLEDIIGTTRYKEPIEKLQARIETLNEERQEKLNRLKVVESERDALKGPMEETVNFLKTENRIAHLKNKKFQLLLHKINKTVCETEEEKQEVVKNMKNIDKKLNEMQEQKSADKEEMDALNKTLQKKLKQFEEMNEINKNAEKKNTGLTEELSQLKKNRKKMAESLKTEQDKLKNLLKVPEKNQSEIEKLTEEEKALDEARKTEEVAFQAVMSNLQKETRSFQEEKDKLQAEQIKLQKKYDDARSAYELAKSERDIYLSTEQNEKLKLEQLQSKHSEVVEKLCSRKSDLQKLEKELPQLEEQMKKAQGELNSTKSRVSAITGDLRKYQVQLEEKKCSMSANRSRNRVNDYLMQLKREGRAPGIFGRLGDLGAIDEKYDVAVSTASSALDFILVDTKETIEICLRALKDDNVGRTTFLALEKMEHYRSKCETVPKTPENVPRLFDLIRVQDQRVRPAFYHAVRETLVAENLDQASRIAYGVNRHRVVTLGGELIEVSGTMSGGGRQVMRGKMGSSISVNTDASAADEVSNLEQTVCRLEEQLTEIREQEKSSEEIITRCAPQIMTTRMNINKLTIEITGLSKQEPELKSQISSQIQKVKECIPNAKRVKELEAKVQATEKECRKTELDVKAIEEKVSIVHEKIMEITEGKTKKAQEKLDNVIKKWEKTRSTITQLQVAIKTAERNAKKTRERIENMETELKEAEKREQEIEEERETLTRDCMLSAEKAAQLKEGIDEKQSRLNELQEDHRTFMQEVNKIKATKLKEEQKLETIEKKLSDIKKDAPVVKSKLEKLTLHKIPVFREPEDEALDANDVVTSHDETNQQPKETPNETTSDTEFIQFSPGLLDTLNITDITTQLQKEEEYLKTLTPNLNTLQDYEKKTQQFIERTLQLKQITERRNLCRQGYEETRKNRLQEFMSSFNIISNKLKELYQMLTMGGDAELDLHDSLDPFTEGINFCVRPPKKSWKNITNLSGGEKTLSSLALVFALHYYRPTPLYVMDEIDAALDFKNVSIVGYYIKERTKNAQFIVISLRTNMFELAHMLTGIYKTYNCTKTVTIRPDDFCRKSGLPSISATSTSKETERHSQLSTRTNQNEERKRKSNNRNSSNVVKEMNVRNANVTSDIESDKEKENDIIGFYINTSDFH